jgi:DNA-binding MarR family transcriptional regulator
MKRTSARHDASRPPRKGSPSRPPRNGQQRAAAGRPAPTEVTAADATVGDLGGALGFMRLLWAIDHGLQSLSKRMRAAFGVTGPQRLVLRLVGRYPNITPGRMAALLAVDPSTLTGVLQRLEQRHLITRVSDPRDRRRALFRLTASGRYLDSVRDGTVEAVVGQTLALSSPRERAATAAVLARMAAELEAAVAALTGGLANPAATPRSLS